MNKERLNQSARHLVQHCGRATSSDKILVVSDESTASIAEFLFANAKDVSSATEHVRLPAAEIHGQEPPAEVASKMSDSTLILAVTKMSLAHTDARYQATLKGARYMSLADYSEEVMSSDALLADFEGLIPVADGLADRLTKGNQIRFTTPLGTDLSVSIEGRSGNSAPGVCTGPGSLASPPDAEANVAVLEGTARGRVIVDGSIPCAEIGLLKEPVEVEFDEGRIVQFVGAEKPDSLAATLKSVYEKAGNPKAFNLGEFGIGLNPKAKLQGFMLEDEGCLGTVHLGVGSNATIGGKNSVPFHLDMIVRHAAIEIDDQKILENGQLLT